MPSVRVMIVDDAVVMRRMISEILSEVPELEVVATAPNGRIALQKIPQVNPDIITMDVEMPDMDGLEAVRALRRTHPKLPVIMLSALTEKGAESTLDALAAGATDYVTKPAAARSFTEGFAWLKAELLPKIRLHCRKMFPTGDDTRSPFGGGARQPVRQPVRARKRVVAPGVLAIGCSTGGPNALAELFECIPRPLPLPCVIVQHMPPMFTKMLAERLGQKSPHRFFEGNEGQRLEPGCVYIAPGGRHMEVKRRGVDEVTLHLHDDPPENSCRPAVDVLFRSVAAVYGDATLALVLTGMGQDGLRGCQHIQEKGGRILAQDKASSVVWGMPGYVAEAGLAEQVLDIPGLGDEVMKRCHNHELHHA